MKKSNIAISAVAIKKKFGAITAADNINLSISSGEKISLIGSNGAGKTTFINMVTGYTRPDSGEILIHNKNILGMSPRKITRLGVARSFQIPQLYQEMNVIENILVAISSEQNLASFWQSSKNKESLNQAEYFLEKFKLLDYSKRTVNELSGGIRKLLDIVLTLTRKPKILFLDEPTSGVSTEEKFPLMDTIIKALSNENVTVIFVEHDMEIVERYSERIAAFYNGQIIADDSPEKVLSKQDVQKYITGSLTKEKNNA
tara:strand:+ start:761 stop:1534 length:774 start_codon:yes stop_codon:yes gene_type:complete